MPKRLPADYPRAGAVLLTLAAGQFLMTVDRTPSPFWHSSRWLLRRGPSPPALEPLIRMG